ncbi:MAG: hypothetical protein OIF51_12925 [Cellvibrionaceae bacterium]|nr:hypothetical protein [Cellvibrionaceae bacterium]
MKTLKVNEVHEVSGGFRFVGAYIAGKVLDQAAKKYVNYLEKKWPSKGGKAAPVDTSYVAFGV